jgi:phosphoglycerol transferase MdoB-like AlkP superfamily enzyme
MKSWRSSNGQAHLEVIVIVNLSFRRRSLLTCAALLVVVALVVAAGVIPPVKGDTFPLGTPQRAVPAFWINVLVTLLAAAVLAFIAIRAEGRSRPLTIALGLLAFLALLLAVALTDAAFAYRSHGPAMHTASILLFLCAAVDFLAAMLVTATAFLLPERT